VRRVEDDELQLCATQEVAGSKSGLTAADDDGIDHVLGRHVSVRRLGR